MKKFVMLCLCAALFITAATARAGDGSWDRVKKEGKLVLGLDDTFPLMGFRDADGRLAGFDIDLAGEVGRRLGVEVQWRSTRWDGIVHALNEGTFDAIWNGMTVTDDRSQVVVFTKPYIMGGQVAVVRSADKRFRRMGDLKEVKAGICKDSSAMEALERLPHVPAGIFEYDDIPAALAGLANGAVDVVIVDCMPGRDALAKQSGRFRMLPGFVRRELFGVAFRKGEKDLLVKVQQTLDALRKDGTMAKLSRKWFGEDLTNPKKW